MSAEASNYHDVRRQYDGGERLSLAEACNDPVAVFVLGFSLLCMNQTKAKRPTSWP